MTLFLPSKISTSEGEEEQVRGERVAQGLVVTGGRRVLSPC